MLDPVDALIMDEAPVPTGRVLVVDAPALASVAAARGWEVIGYADLLPAERTMTVPVVTELTPEALAGVDLVLMRLPKAVAALTEYAQLLARAPGVLDRLPDGPAVDLGSGNGTLAVLLATQGREVIAVDESRAGVLATAASARLNGVDVDVRRRDGLSGFGDGELGLVVCNPPFHIGTAKDSTPALTMIDDAARALRPDGELWLVWNSRLPYLPRLRRVIGRTSIVARNPKFTVTRSVRSIGRIEPAPQQDAGPRHHQPSHHSGDRE